MLARLCIDNFTIIERLEVALERGMTVVTGETGAGKSIMVDALALALGGRADSKAVRPGCAHASITAVFNIDNLTPVRDWLRERNLDNDDGECYLRRVVGVDGRSKAYVNGCNMPIREVQVIAQHLATICGQHAHYALLDSRIQQNLLDNYGQLQDTSSEVHKYAEQWQQLKKQLDLLRQGGDGKQQCELLRYQIRDIEALNINVAECIEMEEEYKRHAAADELLSLCRRAQQLNNGEGGSNDQLSEAVRHVGDGLAKDDRLQEAHQHLYSALQHGEEAARALENYADSFDIDPQRLRELEQKLNDINRIAKLHDSEVADLPGVLARLKKELESFESNMGLLENGEQQLAMLQERYMQHAGLLSEKRADAAVRLCAGVEENLGALQMSHCRFEVLLNKRENDQPHTGGLESVRFVVSTNPGHPTGSLDKVASGGELSRISLALQVTTMGVSTPACLVFDEVDSGVGSNAAHQVGRLLARLGEHGQVLCVTHLAQVAACAQQHWVVSKEVLNNQTATKLRSLRDMDERVEEMARIISGHNISDQARAHARELLHT